MPDIMFRLTPEGAPLFREFAEAIVPTEFAPGVVFGSGGMQPIDYMLDMGEGRIEQPVNLDLATVQQQELAMTFRYHIHPVPLAPGRGLGGARIQRDHHRLSGA